MTTTSPPAKAGSKKLTPGNKNILRLIRKDQDAEGWTPVSHIVAPLFRADAHEPIPTELFELEPVGDEGRCRVRLTEAGNDLLNAMVYL